MFKPPVILCPAKSSLRRIILAKFRQEAHDNLPQYKKIADEMSSTIEKLMPRMEVFNFLEKADYPIIEKYMFNHDYDKGSYVFKEGAHGGYMFFIANGEVEVIKQFDTAKHTIATLSAGRSVGEMSLIDGSPRSATVRAKTALQLIVLKREDFNKLNDEQPAIANKILMGIASLLSTSLRETNDRFTEKLLSIC